MASRRGPGVEVVGAKDLRKQLKALDDFKEIRPELLDVYRAAAEVVAEDARPRVPVLTGRLRDSIRATATQTSGSVAIGKKKIPYAAPIHFGWPAHNIRANPFLYDAADAKADAAAEVFLDRVASLMQRTIDKADASGNTP